MAHPTVSTARSGTVPATLVDPTQIDLARRVVAAAAAALAGLTLLAAVGFSHPHALHEATHDTRHAAGFPCH